MLLMDDDSTKPGQDPHVSFMTDNVDTDLTAFEEKLVDEYLSISYNEGEVSILPSLPTPQNQPLTYFLFNPVRLRLLRPRQLERERLPELDALRDDLRLRQPQHTQRGRHRGRRWLLVRAVARVCEAGVVVYCRAYECLRVDDVDT